MAEKGWEDLDISEWVSYDSDTHFPFLGTEEERNEVLERLKGVKEQKWAGKKKV